MQVVFTYFSFSITTAECAVTALTITADSNAVLSGGTDNIVR